jgi:hypothetical protein
LFSYGYFVFLESFESWQQTDMKKFSPLLILFFCCVSAVDAYSESLLLSGVYQGKDLYVKNPFSDDGVGFCVYEVYVNGELTRDEVNSSAFAIDFNVLGIEVGNEVEIIINHKDRCSPLVLNPEAIKPHSTFEVATMEVKNNILNWTSEGESGALPYIVEQFRWNKWVKAGEVMGEGKKETTQYKFELTPHSGENKVRVKQVDYTGKPRYSKAVTYNPGSPVVSFEPKKVADEITFSSPTRYEVFDKYGNLVKTGFGKTINVANLQRGDDYYLNYDNSFGETFKKK